MPRCNPKQHHFRFACRVFVLPFHAESHAAGTPPYSPPPPHKPYQDHVLCKVHDLPSASKIVYVIVPKWWRCPTPLSLPNSSPPPHPIPCYGTKRTKAPRHQGTAPPINLCASTPLTLHPSIHASAPLPRTPTTHPHHSPPTLHPTPPTVTKIVSQTPRSSF